MMMMRHVKLGEILRERKWLRTERKFEPPKRKEEKYRCEKKLLLTNYSLICNNLLFTKTLLASFIIMINQFDYAYLTSLLLHDIFITKV